MAERSMPSAFFRFGTSRSFCPKSDSALIHEKSGIELFPCMNMIVENSEFFASAAQREVLLQLLDHPAIESDFFLTGGTALAVFYLRHRLSDDLDFFSTGHPDLPRIDFWIRTQWPGNCSKIKMSQKFLSYLIQETRVEFVIDPLSNKKERGSVSFENGRKLFVDNMENIVSNKLGAMVSRQEPKDFVDFYFLMNDFPDIQLDDVYKNARLKDAIFDDPPTAAFQLEEGLALIRENPFLLPEMKRPFPMADFLVFFEKIAAWIYQKIRK